MLDTAFFGALAFLEMLSQKGEAPAPAPAPSPYVPASVIPPPGVIPQPFKIPPPGDIGPPPPGFIPPDVPIPAVVPPPVTPVTPLPMPVPSVVPPPGILPPWNQGVTAPCPASLPPFPGPSWTPCPTTPDVVARALYWNPILWDYPSKTIAHASVCESLGGTWTTFVAAWHPGDSGPQTYMAVEAWCQGAAPTPVPVPPMPVPPPQPAPTPVVPVPVVPTPTPVVPVPVVPTPTPVTPVVPTVVQTPLQAAAVAMANALNAYGYKLSSQPIYKTFQKLAGTTADGYPGTGTMTLLRQVLATIPLPMPNVPIYPWKAGPGYDGVNAPTLQQWTGQAAPVPIVPHPNVPVPSVVPASGPPGLVGPYPGTGAWQSNSAYIARYQNALQFLGFSVGPTGPDGKYGPNTAAAVKAFQTAYGLSPVDGEAGAATAAALDQALQGQPNAAA